VNEAQGKNLKEVMDKENLNWRSFAYQEAINAKWNASTPAYYVIDHQGVIRYKWVGYRGEQAIDVALEKLIKVAEGM
jgi:peroxiredoxin